MNNKLIITLLLIGNIAFSQIRDTIYTSFSTISSEVILKEKEIIEKVKKEKVVQPFLNSDTLYILFEHRKNTDVFYTPKNYMYNNIIIRDTTITYRFFLKDSTHIDFFYRKYFGWDELEVNTKSIVKKERKCFLRKNKKKILSHNFFEVNEEKQTNYFLTMLRSVIYDKKNIFIIDDNEIHKGIITLREVKFNSTSHSFFTEKI